jgi:hypothetical protein
MQGREDVQGMLPCIAVLHHKVDHVSVIKHIAVRPVCYLASSIFAQSQCAHDRGYHWRIVNHIVDERMICPIVHCLEVECKLKGSCWGDRRRNIDGNQSAVVCRSIGGHGGQSGEVSGGRVRDGGGNICKGKLIR